MEVLKKIKTYKNPLNQRFAFYYGFYKNAIIAIVAIAVAVPMFFTEDIGDSTFAIIILALACFFGTVSIINLISMFTMLGKFKYMAETQGKSPNHLTIFVGPPGAGKTLLEVLFGYFMATSSWLTLQFERWLKERELRQKKEEALKDEDTKEIVDAYDFFINNEGIPCLASNVPIYSYEYRRYSYKFGAEHLKQEERVPYRTVGIVDEIGTTCTLEMFKDRSNNYSGAADMADFMRLDRQHAECRVLGSEQSPDNIYKDARRVVAQIVKCAGVKNVHQSIFLKWLYNFLEKHFVKRMKASQAIVFSNFMLKLRKFLHYSGFVRIEYTFLLETFDDKGNLVKSEERRGRGGRTFKMYVPAMMPIKYRSRFLRESYKALNKPIRLAVYTSLGLAREEAMSRLKAEALRLSNEQRSSDKRETQKQAYADRLKIKQEVRESYAKSKKSSATSNQ